MWWFLFGLFLGGILGFGAAAVLSVSKNIHTT